MKKTGIYMSLLMGVTLSLCLSLAGTLGSGNFTLPAFLISFGVSFVISLVIGFLVPMKKVSDAAVNKLGLERGKLSASCFETLLSDLIYTPIITVVMVTLAYKSATSHGAHLNYAPMLIRSLIINFILGFVLIFIFMPVYMKMLIKKFAPGGPTQGGKAGQRPEDRQ